MRMISINNMEFKSFTQGNRMRLLTPLILGAALLNNAALAADEVTLLIDHHKFSPSEINIPAGTKTKIIIHNQDAVPVEFESYDLSREIVVPGHGESPIFVGPLEAGTYQFFNDFDHDMQDTITVKAKGN